MGNTKFSWKYDDKFDNMYIQKEEIIERMLTKNEEAGLV
jgi:hypothetical protein